MTDKTLYDSDYHLWIQENIHALESRDISKVDIPNLLTEIRKLENAEVQELKKLLMRLMANLLSWSTKSSYRTPAWADMIFDLRKVINSILKVSPSFKNELLNFCNETYPGALYIACNMCDLNNSAFPKTLQMSVFELLKYDFSKNIDEINIPIV
jgi:hypothetical protein